MMREKRNNNNKEGVQSEQEKRGKIEITGHTERERGREREREKERKKERKREIERAFSIPAVSPPLGACLKYFSIVSCRTKNRRFQFFLIYEFA